MIELREDPDLVGAHTFDLSYLRAIHYHLFQDVFVWAGDVRTVGIEKDEESFCPPKSINQPMNHVATEISPYLYAELLALSIVYDTRFGRPTAAKLCIAKEISTSIGRLDRFAVLKKSPPWLGTDLPRFVKEFTYLLLP